MFTSKASLLIVDDDVPLRHSLTIVLTNVGYRVRSVNDGFSALAAIRSEQPDVLLSDLNMQGMSGFELLSVVRRRFPAIRVIAMSGAFTGRDAPPGIAADAFHRKGGHLNLLLPLLKSMTGVDAAPMQRAEKISPIWIPGAGLNADGKAYVTLSCPECLRTFPHALGGNTNLIHETVCIHCSSAIPYALVQQSMAHEHGFPSDSELLIPTLLCG